MIYPAGVQVIIAEDRIRRVTILSPGYLFQGKGVNLWLNDGRVHALMLVPRK